MLRRADGVRQPGRPHPARCRCGLDLAGAAGDHGAGAAAAQPGAARQGDRDGRRAQRGPARRSGSASAGARRTTAPPGRSCRARPCRAWRTGSRSCGGCGRRSWWSTPYVRSGRRRSRPVGPRSWWARWARRRCGTQSAWADGLAGVTLDLDVAGVGRLFEQARADWADEERPAPRLTTSFWFAVGDEPRAQIHRHLRHYMNWLPTELVDALAATAGFAGTPSELRDVLRRFEDIGTDEVQLIPTSADLSQVERIAEPPLTAGRGPWTFFTACCKPEQVSDWFLPAAERAWTSGNAVVPHVHGVNYFARLLEVVGATDAGRPDLPDRLARRLRRAHVGRRPHRRRAARVRVEARGRGTGAAVAISPGPAQQRGERRTSGPSSTRAAARHSSTSGSAEAGRTTRSCSSYAGRVGRRRTSRSSAASTSVTGAATMPTTPGIRRHRRWTSGTATPRRGTTRWSRSADLRWPTSSTPSPSVGTTPHRSTTATPYRAVMHRLVRMPRHPEQLPERWDPPPEVGTHQVQVLRTYPAKRPAYPFAPEGRADDRTVVMRSAFTRARRA